MTDHIAKNNPYKFITLVGLFLTHIHQYRERPINLYLMLFIAYTHTIVNTSSKIHLSKFWIMMCCISKSILEKYVFEIIEVFSANHRQKKPIHKTLANKMDRFSYYVYF